ncbi:hypothetical protein ACIQUB_30700 [Rhizobium sp. NPDC090275]|uniref:hypothetical protein n=1 Tax=Rhizobium sp. NPDC090275 TaxID=3364498 RepID=UPI00383AEA1E
MNAALLILTLFATDIGLSDVKRWRPGAGCGIDGVPTILVVDGIYDNNALRGCRLDIRKAKLFVKSPAKAGTLAFVTARCFADLLPLVLDKDKL